MKDIYTMSPAELLQQIKKFLQVFKGNSLIAKQKFKLDYPEMFTEEFHQHFRKILYSLGVTDDLLQELHQKAAKIKADSISVH